MSAYDHKKSWCELCLDLRWEDAPLDIHHHHYLTYGKENPEDVVTLCRNCHIAVETEHEKSGKKGCDKRKAFETIKTQLVDPKFVTVAELGVDPDLAIKVLENFGLISTSVNEISPTSMGIKSGIIKETKGGFLVRCKPLIANQK